MKKTERKAVLGAGVGGVCIGGVAGGGGLEKSDSPTKILILNQ
jgi:hypothetical protein